MSYEQCVNTSQPLLEQASFWKFSRFWNSPIKTKIFTKSPYKRENVISWMCSTVNYFISAIKIQKNHIFVHLTLKSRSEVNFKITNEKSWHENLYVLYSKLIHICNKKAEKSHFVHLTLKIGQRSFQDHQ